MRKNDIIKKELLNYYNALPEEWKKVHILNITYNFIKNNIVTYKQAEKASYIDFLQDIIYLIYDNLVVNGEFITNKNIDEYNEKVFNKLNISARTISDIRSGKKIILINHPNSYDTKKDIKYFIFKQDYNIFNF